MIKTIRVGATRASEMIMRGKYISKKGQDLFFDSSFHSLIEVSIAASECKSCSSTLSYQAEETLIILTDYE